MAIQLGRLLPDASCNLPGNIKTGRLLKKPEVLERIAEIQSKGESEVIMAITERNSHQMKALDHLIAQPGGIPYHEPGPSRFCTLS